MRVVCEACAAPQPVDWRAGDLCTSCGGATRRESRCPWCARFTPGDRFCRGCGCELVPDERWGAARMLRAAGVDRFALATRLRDMDAGQVEHLQAMFEAERARVVRRADELRLVERGLAGSGWAAAFEDEWLARLPLDDGTRALLDGGPRGPFDDEADWPAIAATSPWPPTRTLAALALLRRGLFHDALFAVARAAIGDADADIAVEAALFLGGHWATRLPGWSRALDFARLVPLAEAALAAPGVARQRWAAVALARAVEARRLDDDALPATLPELLRDALGDGDRDLALGAAMALGLAAPLVDGLGGNGAAFAWRALPPAWADALPRGEALRAVGLGWLAGRAHSVVASALTDGSDDERNHVLQRLPKQVPEELAEPLVVALERGDEAARERALWKLDGLLTLPRVERVLATVARTRDGRVLQSLLRLRPLPEPEVVLRAMAEHELFALAWVPEALDSAARDGLLPLPLLRQLLDEATRPEAQRGLTRVGERVLEADFDAAIDRRLTRLALGAVDGVAPAVRVEAVWALLRSSRQRGLREPPFRLTPADADAYFGGPTPLAVALTAVLADRETLREVGYYDWVADLLGYGELPAIVAAVPEPRRRDLALALAAVARDEALWTNLRSAAERLATQFGG